MGPSRVLRAALTEEEDDADEEAVARPRSAPGVRDLLLVSYVESVARQLVGAEPGRLCNFLRCLAVAAAWGYEEVLSVGA